MKNLYLFIYDEEVGSREEVKDCLNKIPEITHWRYDIPNSFYLLSAESSDSLTDKIKAIRPNGRFFITEIHPNRQGYLQEESWYFIRHKAYKPKDSK